MSPLSEHVRTQRNFYLSKADDAERTAQDIRDDSMRDSWRSIAESWRALATIAGGRSGIAENDPGHVRRTNEKAPRLSPRGQCVDPD
jgi:hypothetical protein